MLSEAFGELTAGLGVEVRFTDGDKMGKGLYASRDLPEDTLLLHEHPVVGMQHVENKDVVSACDYCLRPLGSVEEIANTLLASQGMIPHNWRENWTRPVRSVVVRKGCCAVSTSQGKSPCCPPPSGEAGKEEEEAAEEEDTEEVVAEEVVVKGDCCGDDGGDKGCCGGGDGMPDLTIKELGMVEELLGTGMPSGFPCRGSGNGCGMVYCTEECEETAWMMHHSLLCLGMASVLVEEAENGETECGMDELVRRRDALEELYTHVIPNINEVFLLAAQVLANVSLRYLAMEEPSLDAAWLPFATVRRGLWWEVAVDQSKVEGGEEYDEYDEDEEEQEEEVEDDEDYEYDVSEFSFVPGLQAMVHDAHDVIVRALDMGEEGLAPLFADEAVVAELMGMFEMNSLSMLAPSPLDAYLAALKELPQEEQARLHAVAGRGLAVAEELAGMEEIETDAEGVGLFLVYSNINHSCVPNAISVKDRLDVDGRAVLLSVEPLKEGDQIFVPYIDESQDYDARVRDLAEYHFVCQCRLCQQQRA